MVENPVQSVDNRASSCGQSEPQLWAPSASMHNRVSSPGVGWGKHNGAVDWRNPSHQGGGSLIHNPHHLLLLPKNLLLVEKKRGKALP